MSAKRVAELTAQLRAWDRAYYLADQPVVDDAKSAYTDAARDTAWVAALFVLFGLLVSFGLPKDDPDRESSHTTPPS